MPAAIFRGNFVKLLKNQLQIGDDADIQTGTDDPTSVAKDAPRSSLYLRDTGAIGQVFSKQDDGSSTNWTLIPFSTPNLTVATETTTATVGTSDDVVLADSSGGAYTLTLPAIDGSDVGKILIIKKTTTDFAVITLDGDGGDTIEGSVTSTLNTFSETVELVVATATNWEILDRKTRTDVISFTMVPDAVTTAPTKGTTDFDQAYWWRDGHEMMIRWDFKQTVAGTAGSGNYFFPIPTGVTMDSGRIDLTDQFDAGNCGTSSLSSTTEGRGVGSVVTRNTVDLYIVGTSPTLIAGINSTQWDFADGALELSFLARVPISGWKS